MIYIWVTASAAIFLNNDKPFQVGERLAQHELAETLREISKRGTDGFYRGWVGAAIVASNQAGKGLLTQEEYADIDTILLQKYSPYLGGLLSDMCLLYPSFRVIDNVPKGGTMLENH